VRGDVFCDVEVAIFVLSSMMRAVDPGVVLRRSPSSFTAISLGFPSTPTPLLDKIHHAASRLLRFGARNRVQCMRNAAMA
jgi:hypothetical protein